MKNDIFLNFETTNTDIYVSYTDVEDYVEKHSGAWHNTLNSFEEKIIKARDKGFPIYSTKCRIKTQDSIFLKTKRRSQTLDSLTDYSGIRILCLFEADLHKVHTALLDIIKNDGYFLDTIKMYNFNDPTLEPIFQATINEKFENPIRIKKKTKSSGYKSIHYIAYITSGSYKCPLEIQLRTLLQDVWGELEHALSYKRGSIHPHIKKSFTLLAQDIERNDMLMSHLKDIYNKEQIKDRYGVSKLGLRHYFKYEQSIIPHQLSDESIQPTYIDYMSEMSSLTSSSKVLTPSDRTKAQELFDILDDNLSRKFGADTTKDKKLKYWLDMERALLHLLSKDYKEALTIYEAQSNLHKDRYVIYFRIGEIHFINNEIPKALREFDKSNSILSDMLKRDSDSLELYDNLMLIKRKLAYTYWLLGDEYIDHALNIANEITALFKSKNSGSDNDKSLEATLYNNLCWYELEKWQSLMKEHSGSDIPVSIETTTSDTEPPDSLAEEIKKHEQLAHIYFEKLRGFIEEKELAGENISSNWLDTAAWYCFLRFKKYAEEKDRNLAVDLAKRCDSGINYATLSLTSLSIHLNHLTEILSIAEPN